jgi:hypothetical protein
MRMKKYWPFIFITAGLLLIFGSLLSFVIYSNIPYQNLTPAMWANFYHTATAICISGSGIFIFGLTARVVRLVSQQPSTALRLFWISLAGIPVCLVIAFISFGLWWQLAFSWEGDPPPVIAYIVLWASGISAVVGVLSAVVMLVTGLVLLSTKISKMYLGFNKG